MSLTFGQYCVARLCILVAGYALMSSASMTEQGELREYCYFEAFNASCQPDEVIMMTSAKYGRMRFGRCMKENHRGMGCYADVLTHLDRICSGHNSCDLHIPDQTLHSASNCPNELMMYLEASYTCLKVRDADSADSCHPPGVSHMTSQSGYMTSVADSHTLVGTTGCPWLIQVERGRRINLTMYNFAETAAKRLQTTSCGVYVIIRDANTTAELPACGGWHRQTALWVSHSDRIQLHIRRDPGEARQIFILHYEAIGCADVVGVKNAIVRRTGNTAVVKCRYTGDTYFLSCVNSHWNGELQNCSHAAAMGVEKPDVHTTTFPFGLLMVTGLGVALGVAIGIVFLAVVLVCWRKRKRNDVPMMGAPTFDPLLAGTHDADDTDSHMYGHSWMECPYGFVSVERTRSAAPCPEQMHGGSVEISCPLHSAAGSVTVDLQQFHRLSSAAPRAQYSPPCGAAHRTNSRGELQPPTQCDTSTSFTTFKPPDDAPPDNDVSGDRTLEGIAASVDLLRDAMSEDDYRELNLNAMSPDAIHMPIANRGYTLVNSTT